MPEAPERIPLICTTRFEESCLIRAGLDQRARIICTGPGPKRMVAWAETIGPADGTFILTGLAAALRDGFDPGEAFVASNIINRDGRRFSSPLSASVGGRSVRAIVASNDVWLHSASERAAVAEKTGADLLDRESGVFAEAATLFGWRFAIVKGVVHGAKLELPTNVDRWRGSDGSVRSLSVVAGLATRPASVFSIGAFRANGRRAMMRAAGLIDELIA